MSSEVSQSKKAYLAGGCFWGMEELFRELEGVIDTEVGYTGGDNAHPTYESHPGHAEALEVSYNPDTISYEALLDFFFHIHDPTTLNRQGNDAGSSYRSAIFYQTQDEKARAAAVIEKVNQSGAWKKPVVTSLEPLTTFWAAEDYHQDYLQQNPGGYTCHFVREMPSFAEAFDTSKVSRG